MYTSGSTGRPKGVEVPRSAVSALFAENASWEPLKCGESALAFHSATFDVSVWELFRPLTVGACVVICDSRQMRDPGAAARLALDAGVVHVCLTPTAFRGFSAELCAQGAELRSLRAAFLCGEALYPRDVVKWFETFGDSVAVWNVYGPTEATVYATAHRMALDDDPETSEIGRRLGHVSVRVEGAGDSELILGGPGIACGYRNLPELTAERFVTTDGVGEFRTGDLVQTSPAGSLLFVGRRDGLLKIRGYRVELGDVEANLRQHPAVAQSVAVAADDNQRILAGVVASAEVDERTLKTFLASRLPPYLRPRRIVFLEAIPMTPSYKTDRVTAAHLIQEQISPG